MLMQGSGAEVGLRCLTCPPPCRCYAGMSQEPCESHLPRTAVSLWVPQNAFFRKYLASFYPLTRASAPGRHAPEHRGAGSDRKGCV